MVDLAEVAGVTPQTASAHLASLKDGGLLRQRKQGRHRHYALASDEVANLLEVLMGLAAGGGHLRRAPGPKDSDLRCARSCFNHLAGQAGTVLYRSSRKRGLIDGPEGSPALTAAGDAEMRDPGLDLDALRRDCLDRSERTTHLAGSLGCALLTRPEEMGWVRRSGSSRAVSFTPPSKTAFARLLRG